MSDVDEAEAYLKRVQAAARQEFKRGFKTVMYLEPASASAPAPVVVDLRAANRTPALPMKRKQTKRRRGSDEDDEDGTPNVTSAMQPSTEAPTVPLPVPATAAVPSTEATQLRSSPQSAPVSGAPKRISLLDRYFPGNLLKNSSLDVALSPPSSFVDRTVSKVSAMREQVVLLRSTLEDAEELMTGNGLADAVNDDGEHVVASAEARAAVICEENWKGIRDLLADATRRRAKSMTDVRRQVDELCRRKATVALPAVYSTALWHTYLDTHGPESSEGPTMSDLVWTSHPCTTLFFTVLTQRFLRVVQQCERVAQSLARLDVVADGQSSGVVETEGGHHNPENSGLMAEQPRMDPNLTPAATSLLIFLRCLMPFGDAMAGDACRSGYGTWLFACLCALDTPLDPDTDRLAHSLFRTCCDQLRTLGSELKVQGDSRGALWEQMHSDAAGSRYGSTDGARSYSSLQDVGSEEVRALYTLIIVLAKFFRQNQNRLITL